VVVTIAILYDKKAPSKRRIILYKQIQSTHPYGIALLRAHTRDHPEQVSPDMPLDTHTDQTV
jgi:hypothetical protein